MSDDIINDIEEAIYETRIKYTDEFPGEPKLVVQFSHEGYNRARGEQMASCFFNDRHGVATTFAGYPFEQVLGQIESFKIKVEGL